MLQTGLFELKNLKKGYELQKFLADKNITINIYSEYIYASKFDWYKTEFLFIEYPENIQLLIDYWISCNNIEFFEDCR